MGDYIPNSLFPTEETPQAALLNTGSAPTAAASVGEVNWREQFPDIVGRSSAMSHVLETVSKVAKSSSPVLILGESGTGKELIASSIHRLSPRCHKNFIAINCSAIPEDLLESELFGHEKGAFTGADKKRVGKFEAARGGTVFLDEIGDMSPRLQAKLLRVLQEMSLTPVGSNEQRQIDIRIIAATNIELQKAIDAGTFRLDLFYRLNVLPIEIPSLKDRDQDALLIVNHFLEHQNRQQRLADPCWLAPDALKAMGNYSWPGNIRQLQNIVERLVIIKGGGRIGIEDLPKDIVEAQKKSIPQDLSQTVGNMSEVISQHGLQHGQHVEGSTSQSHEYYQPVLPLATLPRKADAALKAKFPQSHGDVVRLSELPVDGVHLSAFIESIENSLILQALERTSNNKQRAAKLLGLNRTTLVERIKKRKILNPSSPIKDI